MAKIRKGKGAMGGKTALETIESLGPVSAATFKSKCQIEFVEDLLVRGRTKSGRKELATLTGFSEHQIIQWCNRADLMRIKGVGEEYSDLLEAAGVDTVVELKHRVAENLVKKMEEVAAEAKGTSKPGAVKRVPPVKTVKGWIRAAKLLKRGMEY